MMNDFSLNSIQQSRVGIIYDGPIGPPWRYCTRDKQIQSSARITAVFSGNNLHMVKKMVS